MTPARRRPDEVRRGSLVFTGVLGMLLLFVMVMVLLVLLSATRSGDVGIAIREET
jgi:hypothetical protein